MSPAALPARGERAVLQFQNDRGVPSAVREVGSDGSLCVEGNPGELRSGPPLPVGALLTVVWQRPDAEYRLPARLVGHLSDGWLELLPVGAPERVQRRRFVRAGVAVPIEVTGPHGQHWRGVTLDLSESGLRCRLPAHVGAVEGTDVDTSFLLGRERFTANARVEWVDEHDPDGPSVGLSFLDAEAQSERIRQRVFALQLLNRDAATS